VYTPVGFLKNIRMVLIMQMKTLYSMQNELDQCIRKSKNIVIPEKELLGKTCLAALVEVGEFYVENTKEKSIFEFVDIFHFLLRINNILSLDYMITLEFEDIYMAADINDMPRNKDSDTLDFISSFTKFVNATRTFKYWSRKGPEHIHKLKDLYAVALFNFIALGHTMGFKYNEIIDAYLVKRKENFERQKAKKSTEVIVIIECSKEQMNWVQEVLWQNHALGVSRLDL
jgi:dimeric dUTPase (all-alpha-NTP-PPase superfamily)